MELAFEEKISNEALSGEEEVRTREHGDHTSFRSQMLVSRYLNSNGPYCCLIRYRLLGVETSLACSEVICNALVDKRRTRERKQGGDGYRFGLETSCERSPWRVCDLGLHLFVAEGGMLPTVLEHK
jgi:hypothetical protein